MEDLEYKRTKRASWTAGRDRKVEGWEPRSTECPGRLAALQRGRHSVSVHRLGDGPEPPNSAHPTPKRLKQGVHAVSVIYNKELASSLLLCWTEDNQERNKNSIFYSKNCQVRPWPNLTHEKVNYNSSIETPPFPPAPTSRAHPGAHPGAHPAGTIILSRHSHLPTHLT